MKLFLPFLFCLTFLSAKTSSLTDESCENCQVVLPKKRVENELTTILFKLKAYKKKKDSELETLRRKILSIENRFANYKSKKEQEIEELKKRQTNSSALSILKDKNQKIKELQQQLASTKEQLSQKNDIITYLNQKLTKENQPQLSTIIQKGTSEKWIKITVDNDLNIYDLALKYYGDSQEYTRIYTANQNTIDTSYQIRNGMSLKIPVTENFIEQPMMINTN